MELLKKIHMESHTDNKTSCTVRYLRYINATFTLFLTSAIVASVAFVVIFFPSLAPPTASVVHVDIAYVGIVPVCVCVCVDR